jgi:hypothetical protein
MGGWREATRLVAGSNGAKESVLQSIFNEWATQKTPVAGVPQWLWELPNPERPTECSFGYEFTPDAYWPKSHPRIVGELKYGSKFEPIAIAEAVHHAHLLRLLHGGTPILSVVITQQNYWIRATVAELSSPAIRHLEADLLALDKNTLLWLSCPHATLGEPSSMPDEVPLEQAWTSMRWSSVEGELTWIAHDETSKPPFLHGPIAMLSRFRNSSRYEWVLWTGRLPPLRTAWSQSDWEAAGSFWVWDVEAHEAAPPPSPRPGNLPTR